MNIWNCYIYRLDITFFSEKPTKEGKQNEIKEHDYKSNYDFRMRMVDDSISISKMAFAQSMGGNRNKFYLDGNICYSKRREIKMGAIILMTILGLWATTFIWSIATINDYKFPWETR